MFCSQPPTHFRASRRRAHRSTWRPISHILGQDRAGLHLCHAMLLPHPRTPDALATFAAKGVLDLGAARLERYGRAVHLIMSNPRFLNAEDQTTIDAME